MSNLKKCSRWLLGILTVLALVMSGPSAALADTNKFIEGNGPINKADPLAVAQVFTYANWETGANTSVKSGAGVLAKVAINNKGASSNRLALCDNTSVTPNASGSGTNCNVIGIIDTTSTMVTLSYDVSFANGLVATCLGGTGTTNCAGTQGDVTISYR